MQYTQRKLHRSVNEIRKYVCLRPKVSMRFGSTRLEKCAVNFAKIFKNGYIRQRKAALKEVEDKTIATEILSME